MKLAKTKTKDSKAEIIKAYIAEIKHYIVFAYLFCMLGIFPLYYREQYSGIGAAKYEFFWNTSLYFIGAFLMFVLIKIILEKVAKEDFYKAKGPYKNKAEYKKEIVEDKISENILLKFLYNLSTLDYAVFIYAICVLLSYGSSDFKEYAFKGAAGWEMGLCSQLIFVAIYFILSRQRMFGDFFLSKDAAVKVSKRSEQNKGMGMILWKQSKLVMILLGIHLISSVLVFLFGILHRFEIDPLGMYAGLDLYQKIEFLSTIGQATWFSSYVCTVFAIGVTLFYISEKRWLRIVSGIYSVISFGILVTQNSDSAFIAIAGIMLLLGYFSLNSIDKWCRFWQMMSLMWGTFAGIGVLQKLFADRAVPLDTLSIFFSQSAVTWVMLVISLAIMLFYKNCCKKKTEKKQLLNPKAVAVGGEDKQCTDRIMEITKVIYKSLLILLAAGIFITIIFIYLNTKGYLLKWFGYQSTNHYLLFDYHWGSNRGSTWMVCWQAFLDLPWFQKLFGVGPDSLSAYLYSVPDIRDLLHNLWGNVRLTNAHNEYLNSLLCYGVVGVIVWIAVLTGGISYFYNKAKENPFMIAFALCIMGYACHNIFCYQQVCCTPFLFIALGIGESLTKPENFNTIK